MIEGIEGEIRLVPLVRLVRLQTDDFCLSPRQKMDND